MRRFIPLLGNSQKLDGGALFGHVPKAVWSQWLPPDKDNRITLACRALLVQEEHQNILLETGIGAFFDPQLRERYGVEEAHHQLLASLQEVGLTDRDIDVVVLSHLHFDHAGGLLSPWQADQKPHLLFPNARYLVSKAAWDRACHPHVRDKASFIPGLQALLEASQRLVIVEKESVKELGQDYRFLFTEGHTPGLMHTIIDRSEEGPLIFASDLIPGSHWLHLPVTMGYDRWSEKVADEKKDMLDFAVKHHAQLFYTHDPEIAMSRVGRDEKGKYFRV